MISPGTSVRGRLEKGVKKPDHAWPIKVSLKRVYLREQKALSAASAFDREAENKNAILGGSSRKNTSFDNLEWRIERRRRMVSDDAGEVT